jgi:hypothetical protein
LFSQNTTLASFGLKGSVKSFTEHVQYRYDSLNPTSERLIVKTEYFFSPVGLLLETRDSSGKGKTVYTYNEKNFCVKQTSYKGKKVCYSTVSKRTDTCIVSKIYDSLNVFIFQQIITVDSLDRIVSNKTTSPSGYFERSSFKYDFNSKVESATSIVGSAESEMDNSAEAINKYISYDKKGNWLRCFVVSDYVLSQGTMHFRKIQYY